MSGDNRDDSSSEEEEFEEDAFKEDDPLFEENVRGALSVVGACALVVCSPARGGGTR